ncbi:MAG: hypothetical protein U0228_09060 [Myxococcaceae bacterium]
MRRTRWWLVVACSVSWAVAQPRPPSAAPALSTKGDAGVPSKADAGTAAPAEPLRVPAPATVADLEKVRKEVGELRAKVSELEGRVQKAEGVQRDLEALQKKFDALQARMDAEDDRREAEQQQAAQRRAAATQANQLVNGALQQLSLGTTSNVDAWLRTAEGQYTGNAQRLVQLARQSLANQDLVATRQYLVLAMMEVGLTER